MGLVDTQVEELADNRVRLTVDVPRDDLRHAIDHAASDLAGSVRIPGFRRGKVPVPVLLARLGRERVYTEAVESHIGGWFWNAAETQRIHPVERPEYRYELPTSDTDSFQFVATVAVQPKPELADWRVLEVPAAEPEVPVELVDRELEALRATVAELVPIDDRPAREGDTLVIDIVAPSGAAERDVVVELDPAKVVDELEQALVGASVGEVKQVAYESPDGSPGDLEVTVKEVKEKLLPPLDDELARAASEFETLAELRADIESRLREQLEEELESSFRAAAVDRLVEASRVDASGPLVEARAAELWNGLVASLQRRGIAAESYLQITGQTAEQARAELRAQAERSVAREIVLEAVADELRIEVGDDEIKELIREQAAAAGEDPEAVVERIWRDGRQEKLRDDLRLRAALDRVAAEVKRIPAELARAREKLWTPEKGETPRDTKLWTPGSKEPA